MTHTTIRCRLSIMVVVSLLACVLMPASAAIFSAAPSACHSVSDDRTSFDEDDASKVSASSDYHPAAVEHESMCDKATVPLTTDSVQLPIALWMVLSLLTVFLMHRSAMHYLWRCGPRRYSPALRSHLAIGRIQV